MDLTPVDAEAPVNIRWRVYQRTIYDLIEARKSPTFTAIAKELGLSKQAVWVFFRSQPKFLAWLDEQMKADNGHLTGALARVMWTLGMQGSVPHAAEFMRITSGFYLRTLAVPGGDGDPAGGYVVNMNFLIPRPDYPQIDAQPTHVVPVKSDIPTVAVR